MFGTQQCNRCIVGQKAGLYRQIRLCRYQFEPHMGGNEAQSSAGSSR
ncbi:MAG: hypothetical protein LCH63_15170 [Candidatus Melainabacteria bacterium]|nr:hypothetical protein [Candidatus Melainabacteria bacterium]